MQLTKKDISLIRQEKRIGFVFSGLLFSFGLIGNIIYLAVAQEKTLPGLIIIDSLLIALCFLIPYLTNFKLNKDLKSGIKKSTDKLLQNKVEKMDYEAGSGNLYIPILGDLFAKLWGQKMKQAMRYYLIVDNVEYNVDNELYLKVNQGDKIQMYFGTYSDLFLGFEK
jgi:hypothetical protein